MSAPSESTGTMDRARSLAPMTVAVPALVLAAVLLAVAPWIGIVTSDDGSSTSPPVHSGWVAAVPLLIVILLALSRRAVALACVAGLGLFGVVRLVADLGVVIDPGETLRPELFGIQTLTASPLHANWAAWMLILADLLMLAAAAVAGNVVADSLEPVVRWDAGETGQSESAGSSASAGQRPRLMRSSPSSVVGIIAAAGYLAANLGEAYTDPLPVIRPGFTDIGLWGTITAAVAGLLLAMTVLLSSALESATARGLLVGLGIAAAGPSLVVLVGSIGNSASNPSSLAWLALAAALLLVIAGLLRRDSASAAESTGAQPAPALQEDADEVAKPAQLRRWTVLLALIALISAVLSAVAFWLPQASFVFRSYLSNNSSAAPDLSGDDLSAGFAPAGSIFLLAAAVMLIAGLLALVPRTSAFGRAALTLSWLPVVGAFLFSLEYVNQARSPELVAGVVFQADTTFRSGLWFGVAAVITAIVTAVAAPLVTGRVRDASTEEVPEIDFADRSPWAPSIAGVLTLLVLVGIGPQAWTSDQGSSAGLFAGADRTDFWAIWLTAIAVVTAVWLAVRQPRRDIAVVLLVSSAAVSLSRLVLTGEVRNQLGFTILAGFWFNVVLVVALLVAAVVVHRLIGPPAWTAATSDNLTVAKRVQPAAASTTKPSRKSGAKADGSKAPASGGRKPAGGSRSGGPKGKRGAQ